MTEFRDSVETVSISSIEPYPDNPKKHPEEQVEKIAESIKEYGWDQPIVVDKDDVIIKGHGRLLAAERLGLEEVPVIRTKLEGEEAKAARLADNKTAESGWDFQSLADEFSDLDDDVFHGFDQDEIDDIMGATNEIDANVQGQQKEQEIEADDMDLEHECPECGYRW